MSGATTLTPVHNVVYQDGAITWEQPTGESGDEQVKVRIEELLFAVELPRSAKRNGGYILCCLREDPDNHEVPFELVAVIADEIPSAICKSGGGDHGGDNGFRPLCIDRLPPYLRPIDTADGSGVDVDVIVSTKSGVGLALRFWQMVLQPLWNLLDEELSPPPPSSANDAHNNSKGARQVHITQHAQSVRDFARGLGAPVGDDDSGDDSLRERPKSRTIVLLSGDGGVVDLLNGQLPDPHPMGGNNSSSLHQQKDAEPPLLALLPLGTGNALFHSLHKPVWFDNGDGEGKGPASPLVLGLRTLFGGAPADLPVFRATFSPGSRIVEFTGGDEEPISSDEAGVQGQEQEQEHESENGGKDEGGNVQVSRHETAVSHLYGAVVASYGFHASIVYESDTPEYRVHGDKRFGMVAQELLRESHHYAARVEIRRRHRHASVGVGDDDDDVDVDADDNNENDSTGSPPFEALPRNTHAYILATLLSNLERTFTISPASRPLDGKLRLVHFGPVGGERAMEVMNGAYAGGAHVGMKWDDGEAVGYEEVEELRITTLEEDERWRKVCIDGTIVDIPKGGSVEVRVEDRGPFRVLVDSRVLLA